MVNPPGRRGDCGGGQMAGGPEEEAWGLTVHGRPNPLLAALHGPPRPRPGAAAVGPGAAGGGGAGGAAPGHHLRAPPEDLCAACEGALGEAGRGPLAMQYADWVRHSLQVSLASREKSVQQLGLTCRALALLEEARDLAAEGRDLKALVASVDAALAAKVRDVPGCTAWVGGEGEGGEADGPGSGAGADPFPATRILGMVHALGEAYEAAELEVTRLLGERDREREAWEAEALRLKGTVAGLEDRLAATTRQVGDLEADAGLVQEALAQALQDQGALEATIDDLRDQLDAKRRRFRDVGAQVAAERRQAGAQADLTTGPMQALEAQARELGATAADATQRLKSMESLAAVAKSQREAALQAEEELQAIKARLKASTSRTNRGCQTVLDHRQQKMHLALHAPAKEPAAAKSRTKSPQAPAGAPVKPRRKSLSPAAGKAAAAAKKKLREAENRLAEAEAELAERAERIAQLEAEAGAERERREADALVAARSAFDLQAEVARHREAAESLRGEQALRETELEVLRLEVEQAGAAAHDDRAALGALAERHRAAEAELRTKTDDLHELQRECSQRSQKLRASERDYLDAEKRAAALKSELEAQHRRAEQQHQQLRATEARLAGAGGESQVLREELDGFKAAAAEKEALARGLQFRMLEADAVLAEADAVVARSAAILEDLRREAERAISDAGEAEQCANALYGELVAYRARSRGEEEGPMPRAGPALQVAAGRPVVSNSNSPTPSSAPLDRARELVAGMARVRHRLQATKTASKGGGVSPAGRAPPRGAPLRDLSMSQNLSPGLSPQQRRRAL